MLHRAISFLLDLLFPAICIQCKKEGFLLCAECMATLPMFAPQCIGCGIMVPGNEYDPPGRTCSSCRKKTPIYAFFSPLPYHNNLVRTIIHDYKYRRISSLYGICIQLIIRSITYYKIAIPPDAIAVAIPLHQRRERIRGFNQAELIAKGFAKHFGITYSSPLIRNRNTATQISLLASSRLTNMSGAFSVSHPSDIKGKIVILFDDVKTTGATLQEAAHMLKKAGAKHIWAITLAH